MAWKLLKLWFVAFLASMALGIYSYAHAADKAREIKLTIDQVIAMADVLQNKMESYEKVGTDGRPGRGFYQLDSDTRLAMARNLAALDYVRKIAERARNDLIVQFSEGTGNVQPGTAAAGMVQIELNKLASQEQSLNLFRLKESDLKLKDNPWPVIVLTALLPILE